MRGVHRVAVYSKRLRYDFEVRRNITIIRGDSATGKTTLVDMIQEFINNPSGSPVELICDKTCHVLSGALWKEQLFGMQDSIVFIDEGNEFVRSSDFAKEIQKTDNYYVIVSREALPALPYGVEEIYGIRTSGKYGTLKQTYHEFYRIYGTNVMKAEVDPETVITEDGNSGYQFFYSICWEQDLKCCPADGKSNIFSILKESKDYFSWERFFTALLIEKTQGSYLAYSKRLLNKNYLNEKIKAAILLKMEKIVLR